MHQTNAVAKLLQFTACIECNQCTYVLYHMLKSIFILDIFWLCRLTEIALNHIVAKLVNDTFASLMYGAKHILCCISLYKQHKWSQVYLYIRYILLIVCF